MSIQNIVSSDVILQVKNTTANEDTGIFIDAVQGGAATNSRIGHSVIAGNNLLQFVNNNGFSFTTTSGSNERFRIQSDGKIGVHTASPQKAFEVNTGVNDYVSVGMAPLAVGQFCGINFGYKENNLSYRKSAIVFKRTDLTSNDAQGQIHFLNGPQGSGGSAGLADSRMVIHEGGQVTTPYNPAFRAYLSTERTTNGEVTSGWNDNTAAGSRAYDVNGNFNISNGRFTAPVAGIYVFSVMWDSLNSHGGLQVFLNGAVYNTMWEPTGFSNAAWESRYQGTHMKLAVNDYVTLVVVHASGSNPVHMGSGVWGHFAGCLVG
jgi:hypothetical protein